MLPEKTLEALIKQAMETQAPQLLAELRASGRLAGALADKAAEVLEVFEALEAPELDKLLRSSLGPLQRQQRATELQRRMWEQALQTCLTWPEAAITASPSEG